MNEAFGALEAVYFERRQAAKTAGATSPSQQQPVEDSVLHADQQGADGSQAGMLDDFSRDLHRFASHNDFKVRGQGLMGVCWQVLWHSMVSIMLSSCWP